MHYYKVPIENGMFVGINYSDIIEGIALQRHAGQGFGYVMTDVVYDFEEVTEEKFNEEKVE